LFLFEAAAFFIAGQHRHSTLQSPFALTSASLYRLTIMHLATYQLRLLFTILLVAFTTPLAALDINQLDKTETIKKWGQVIFCQRIYKMPEVGTRLYDFDVEHCEKAGLLMSELTAKYPKQEQEQLIYQAERHSVALSRNTSEPYHSVPACRTYCRELTEIRNKRNDR